MSHAEHEATYFGWHVAFSTPRKDHPHHRQTCACTVIATTLSEAIEMVMAAFPDADIHHAGKGYGSSVLLPPTL